MSAWRASLQRMLRVRAQWDAAPRVWPPQLRRTIDAAERAERSWEARTTMWRDAKNELPPVGLTVLAFGYIAPDGRSCVTIDRILNVTHGPYWDRNDVVTHWAPLEDVPTPDE
jgi:hypothetical protein